MNFASKLMAKAEEAAEAAKNFKGFDEMADQDEYIHSEGLNVKGQNQNQQQQQGREETNSLAESNISAEPTWSLLDRPAVASQSAAPESARGRNLSRNASTISSTSPASSISPPPRQRPPAARPKSYFAQPAPQPAAPQRSAMSYMSVVADALESGPMSEPARQTNRQLSSFSGYDTDNEESVKRQEEESSSSSSSDDSSDDEDDAILSQIRQSKSASSREKRHRKKPKKSKKKNPNRFMEELNRRGPAPVPGSASAAEFGKKKQQVLEMEPLVNATDGNNDGSGAGGRMANLKKWINPFQRNSPDTMVAKATSFLKKGPLSRRDPEAPPPPEDADGSEEFQVVSGSSVLSDDELQALAQMNSQSKMSMFSPTILMQLVKKNPREAFIVFTMLLAIFVFFFTRKTSNENDVQ